jgi:3-methyladenine DNA glycosylase AlkC
MKLKDFFDEQSVTALANAVKSQVPSLAVEESRTRVFDRDWEGRELKQRTRHITTVLHGFLPPDYGPALETLSKVLPRMGKQGLILMVFPDYVEMYGLEDWEALMPAVEEFTQRMSAEFAIRLFIIRYPDRTMAQMLKWAQHENAEVRRLATEGCRPRLPWGIRLSALVADPSPILPILELLKDDESESVRRSVANNVNDISKDNPDVVLDTLCRWQAHSGSQPEMEWIISHALRTLTVSRSPKEWRSYCITPLKLAPSPRCFTTELIFDEVQTHLDHLIEHQTPGGTWDPVWTWGNSYPEAWAQAWQEWRGHLTLRTLTSLQTYGRIHQ